MKPRLLFIFSGVVIGLFLLTLAALDRYGKGSRVYGHAGPLNDPQTEKVIADSPKEIYLLWKSRGLKGRVIVYVGNQWKRIDLKQYENVPLYRPYPLRLFNPSTRKEQEFLDSTNFLYMASITGMARALTVVLTESGFSEISSAAEKAKGVAHPSGSLFFPHEAFPRLFTKADRFRPGSEPVILFVSAAYFKKNQAESLYRTLVQSGVVTDFIALCRETYDDSVSDRERAELVRFAKLIGMETADKF